MKFSDMNKKQLQEAKVDLLKRLKTSFRATRITGLNDFGCTVEGGTFPANFSRRDGLSIWGRGNRYAGGSMTVEELMAVEDILIGFFNEYVEGEVSE